MINTNILHFTLTAISKGLCNNLVPNPAVIADFFDVSDKEVVRVFNVLIQKRILTMENDMYLLTHDAVSVASNERYAIIQRYLEVFSTKRFDDISRTFEEYLFLNKDRSFDLFLSPAA